MVWWDRTRLRKRTTAETQTLVAMRFDREDLDLLSQLDITGNKLNWRPFIFIKETNLTSMKLLLSLLSICLTILSFKSQAQQSNSVTKYLSPQTVKSIDPSNVDFQDLQFLKETLKDNRIVLLGEQSHGEGATFEAKVRLIKFLHQELNYEIISFESGLYDNYKAFENIKDTSYRESPLKESIFRIWSESKEFEPLLKYIHEKKVSTRPLIVTGFDCQADNIFKDEFLNDLQNFLGTSMKLSEQEVNILDEVISAGPEFIVADEADSILFFNTCRKIVTNLESLQNFQHDIKAKILRQSLISWLEIMKGEMDLLNDVPVKVQNPRDFQMAQNLIFLSELYPEKKIIGWGASYHFANQIELFKNTDLTKFYIQKLDSLQKSEDPTDLDQEVSEAVPMGRILKDHFGSKVYSMCFSSFEGEFGMLGHNTTSLDAIRPPSESIEYVLAMRGNNYTFVDYRPMQDVSMFYSSALGNLPVYAPWQKIFDGLFFIKKTFPPSFPIYQIKNPENQIEKSIAKQNYKVNNRSVKQLIDKETGLGVSYANVYLLNTSKGVASNLDGEFIFVVPQAKLSDKVVFSSIGYKTDTLLVREFLKTNRIELNPVATQLAEIEIRSKPLRAKEIVKLAEKKISKNYYQNANQQEFFYRVKTYKEDSVVFNEEASVLVYNPIGYQSSTNASRKLKGQILQFRNTTNNEDRNNSWTGVGSLWLIYTHDLILDKDNVLHRPAYYDLNLKGITMYENKRVYEISFDCKKPSAYTTGFGYPSPISASGTIFIDVDTYTVLKIETLIQRKSYKSKRRPNLLIDPYGHQLIQSYKEYDGRYFLNYSKQIHFGRWTDTKAITSSRNLEIRELLSTDIIAKVAESFTLSLSNIKSMRVKEEPNFWINHNIKLEDNVEETYELMGLSKKN